MNEIVTTQCTAHFQTTQCKHCVVWNLVITLCSLDDGYNNVFGRLL